MFASIRRHQNWIWVIVVTVVCISMVWFFTPGTDADYARGGGRQDFGSINGKPVGLEEFRKSYREVQIGYFMRTGRFPNNDEQAQRMIERETLSRIFLLQKVKEMDIQPSAKAVARVTLERIGNYPYEKLEAEILLPNGLTTDDFERFIRNEAAIQQLIGAAAVSAKLVNPREAEVLYRKEHQEMLLDLAVFWGTNYLSKVMVTNGAIGQFFTNRMSLYRVPERTQISYAEFAISNYLAEAQKEMALFTNLNARIEEVYLRLGKDYFKDTNDTVMSEEAAKLKIKEDELRRLSMVGARRKAAEFGSELMSQPQPNKADNLDKLAAAKGYVVKVTPPFDRNTGLEDLNFPPDFRTKAMSLTLDAPLAFSPIPGSNAVYVIALKGKVPSEMPPLAKVEEKVTADYKNFQALDLARKAGMAFHTNLTNGLLLKKPFAELAQAAEVTTLSLPPISPSTTSLTNIDSRINLQMVQRLVGDMEPGHASQFIPSMEGGMIVYFRERVPLSDEKVSKELPDFLGTLRQYRQGEAFNQWFRKQAEIARVTPPKREEPTPPTQ